MAPLVRYTGLSDRTVRTCLDRLKTEGIIRPCDPDIVAARIKHADRRPKGWDLDLTQIRADLTQTEVTTPDRQFRGRPARAAAIACPDAGEAPGGCNPRTDGGTTRAATGCSSCIRTIQETIPGTAATTARARQTAPADGEAAGGEPARDFFAALGSGWRLTPAQQFKLTPGRHDCPGRGDGRRMRWRLSPERTPPAYTAPTRSWPLGSHPVNCPRRLCDRRGRPGAASATRPPGCSTSTATRRAPARAANRRHTRRRTGRSRRPSPPRSPSGAEGQHGGPHGLEARRPARAPGKTARRHRRPGPSPHSPIMMIMDGERIPRHPPCRSRAYGDHLRGSWRDAPIASSAGSGAAGKALLPVSRACIRSNGRS